MLLAASIIFLWGRAAGASASIETSDLLEFHKHYNVFVREYMGCPNGASEVEECRPASGIFDVKEWLAARRAAKQLFDLKDKEAEVTAR